MNRLLAVSILPVLIWSGLAAQAQTVSSNAGANPVTGAPIPGAMQSLGNVIRIPDAPPPQQPPQVTSEPLALPTSIPPNTVGTSGGR
jgi:hypothetical protein